MVLLQQLFQEDRESSAWSLSHQLQPWRKREQDTWWHLCGVDSGYVPYTAYSAKDSYMKENPQIIQGFTNALQKGVVM